MKLLYCPQCGHALAEDCTAERRFGRQVMLCPAERVKLSYYEFTGVLEIVELPTVSGAVRREETTTTVEDV